MELLRRYENEADTVAPATPEWRVRDVLAHMTGVCDDVINGNLEGVASDEWTAAQVAKRSEMALDQILDEWVELGPAIAQAMTEFPIPEFGQMVFDAATHEFDIRGALHEPGGRESSAVGVGFDWATDSGHGDLLAGDGSFTFATEAGDKTYGGGEPATTLRASRFEVMRAITGRRSLNQMRAFVWEGPPRVEQLVVSAELFQPPTNDLIE